MCNFCVKFQRFAVIDASSSHFGFFSTKRRAAVVSQFHEIYLSVLMLSNNLSENWLKARLMTISF